MIKLIFKILIFLVPSTGFSQGLVINELMADNESVIQDSFTEYSDWLELYNSSDVSVNLEAFYLSDDSENLLMYRLPDLTIEADSYLIIYCSSRDTIANNEIHTNFNLNKGGEKIFLTSLDGTIINEFEYDDLIENESVGRYPDKQNISIMGLPTPGESNHKSGTILFSHDSGIYDSNITLNAFSHSIIYYSVDGSIPNTNSKILKENGIELNNPTDNENIFCNIPSTPDTFSCYLRWKKPDYKVPKINVLRFRVKDEKGLSDKIYTKHFIINPENDEREIISLVAKPKDLFDDKKGIYVPGESWNPDIPCWSGNYFIDKEIESNIFYSDSEKQLISDAGLKIAGAGTRGSAQKSFKLFARSEYGPKKFYSDLFDGDKVKEYDSFVLRTLTGCWNKTLMKDALTQEICKDLDLNTVNTRLVDVYLNGEYWGVYELRNNNDDDFLASKHNISDKSISISHPHYFEEVGHNKFKPVYEFMKNNDLTLKDNYEHLLSLVDIENFINYYCAEIFFNNFDWPSGNTELWKSSDIDDKWRYTLYDLDAGWSLNFEYNMFEHATKNDGSGWPYPDESTLIFRKLLENENFKKDFLTKFIELLNNEFSSENLVTKYLEYREKYENAADIMLKRWGYYNEADEWKDHIFESLYVFAKNRNCVIRNQIVDFFDYSPEITCNPTNIINNTDVELEVYPNPFNDILIIRNINNNHFKLLDITGRTIAVSATYYQNEIHINTTTLSSGVYFLQIDNHIKKIIK